MQSRNWTSVGSSRQKESRLLYFGRRGLRLRTGGRELIGHPDQLDRPEAALAHTATPHRCEPVAYPCHRSTLHRRVSTLILTPMDSNPRSPFLDNHPLTCPRHPARPFTTVVVKDSFGSRAAVRSTIAHRQAALAQLRRFEHF